jgi:murein DD-endopeptidase MepM/ murein hydrolase activator NlpD
VILRLFLLVALVAGGAYVAIARPWAPGAAAAPMPARYEPQIPTERFPAAPLDVPQHGRVPMRTLWVTGFALPEGFGLPEEPELLPGSPREYRGGYHEGVDFPLSQDMPVAAAKGGTIVRIDHDYVEWSVEDQIAGEDVGFKLGYTPLEILDKLRGRQVWIDHGRGIVSRYAHLSSVELFSVGSIVERGTIIGRVGNSGTKAGPHLHIEIRIGDSYLGEGLSGDALQKVLRRAFS